MFVVAFSGILADILSGIQVSHYACDEISMFSCMVLGGWEGGGGVWEQGAYLFSGTGWDGHQLA